jgi:hypothetical protein
MLALFGSRDSRSDQNDALLLHHPWSRLYGYVISVNPLRQLAVKDRVHPACPLHTQQNTEANDDEEENDSIGDPSDGARRESGLTGRCSDSKRIFGIFRLAGTHTLTVGLHKLTRDEQGLWSSVEGYWSV